MSPKRRYERAWVKKTVYWILDRDKVSAFHPETIQTMLPSIPAGAVPIFAIRRALRELHKAGSIWRMWHTPENGRRKLVYTRGWIKGCE